MNRDSFINNLAYSDKYASIMMKETPTKCIFKVNNIFRISILPLHAKISTYDVAYAQFHQDTLGSLKMALLQRRNM
jgi:hypothetical protein